MKNMLVRRAQRGLSVARAWMRHGEQVRGGRKEDGRSYVSAEVTERRE